ncbi:unnamed protein product [Spirodela intermedia]|uniref:Protein kinase domain-containing protein n=1 Tax=Spirodela intermedia TaxID=51605 RepID=A0A7I8J734_SPIIN|nr:unnamed protein product [Spirodela intermedia]CAA6665869.1 unnamed protein product [Spirodela intermedia]
MNRRRVAAIVASSVGAFLFLAIFTGLVAAFFLVPWRRTMVAETNGISRGAGTESKSAATGGGGGGGINVQDSEGPSGGAGKGGGEVFSWEGERLGNLVFCGGVGEMYSLEELLKASAETLGRGTVGSTYKAVMESGFIVTVKRLKDSSIPGQDEFRRRIETLGQLRHPNLVPLRAYFLAKEERLLVYDYFPNGSLYSLIHGTPSGKPLHWTSCLKIAEDVATGLLHLHQNSSVIHGNLKSSNVLLGPDFESCLTDYGLIPYLGPSDAAHEDSGSGGGGAALFYRAPESRSLRRSFTQQSDVYSFGILLLELLTGKTPFHDLVEEHGEGIPQWVRSVREEEIESGDDPASGNDNSEKLGALLNIAVACLSPAPEDRPTTKEVVRMIRDARVEVLASSNSSDHSPGRWSDTVQSLPREYGSEHLNFAERD